MDNSNRTILLVAGALVVGLVLGALFRGGGPDIKPAIDETRALSARVDAIGAEVKGLGERLATIEGSVRETRSAQDSALGDLRGQLEGLGKSVADTTGALGGQVSTAVQSQLEAFRGQISDLVGRTRSDDAAGDDAAGETAGATAPQVATTGTPLTPGQAVTLVDEKLRVFLSSADAQSNSARVAINGVGTTVLTAGEPVEVDGCRVVLSGFDASGTAMIDGGC